VEVVVLVTGKGRDFVLAQVLLHANGALLCLLKLIYELFRHHFSNESVRVRTVHRLRIAGAVIRSGNYAEHATHLRVELCLERKTQHKSKQTGAVGCWVDKSQKEINEVQKVDSLHATAFVEVLPHKLHCPKPGAQAENAEEQAVNCAEVKVPFDGAAQIDARHFALPQTNFDPVNQVLQNGERNQSGKPQIGPERLEVARGVSLCERRVLKRILWNQPAG
jgi:hypothetical protein